MLDTVQIVRCLTMHPNLRPMIIERKQIETEFCYCYLWHTEPAIRVRSWYPISKRSTCFQLDTICIFRPFCSHLHLWPQSLPYIWHLPIALFQRSLQLWNRSDPYLLNPLILSDYFLVLQL